MRPRSLVYGFGINDATYQVNGSYINLNGVKKNIKCPYYIVWANMIKRCYYPKYHKDRPSYVNCTVCDEWKYFSKFKAWMEKQDWKGNCLDKDLLFPNNKIYSEEYCLFVSPTVNSFILDSAATRGEWPCGVSWNRAASMFSAKCRNVFTKKYENLGYFDCPVAAHKAWILRKSQLTTLLIEEQDDQRVIQALLARYTHNTIYQ